MSLRRSIRLPSSMKSRKTNKAKRVDPECANNGSCKYCENNRTYSTRKQIQHLEDELDECQAPSANGLVGATRCGS